MKEQLYEHRPNLTIGFHGCTKSTARKVIDEGGNLSISTNDYDWLGSGIYFWENNYARALEWAEKRVSDKGDGEEPDVIGAIIDLGHCFDLMDSYFLAELKSAYDVFVKMPENAGIENMPKNTVQDGGVFLYRKLDCAVMNIALEISKEADYPFDSVRAVFFEGNPLYPDAGFREKNHIQISVINPNCIKGYFHPRDFDESFLNP